MEITDSVYDEESKCFYSIINLKFSKTCPLKLISSNENELLFEFNILYPEFYEYLYSLHDRLCKAMYKKRIKLFKLDISQSRLKELLINWIEPSQTLGGLPMFKLMPDSYKKEDFVVGKYYKFMLSCNSIKYHSTYIRMNILGFEFEESNNVVFEIEENDKVMSSIDTNN